MIDLDKILELEAKASGAPWHEQTGNHFNLGYCSFDFATGPWIDGYKEKDSIFRAKLDSELIASMRNNIRQICLELKAARECIALLTEQRYEFTARVDRALQRYNEVKNGKG